MAGLMSFIDKLASSPIGKVTGGYLAGEIDERKEVARLKEKKDDQYSDLVNGFATNMLTINAQTLAKIATEEQAFEEGKKWAVSQFGEGGLAMADKMRQDGAFSGATSWNDVFSKLQGMYEVNEGELWYDNQDWINFAEQNTGWKLDTNYYADKKKNIYNEVNKIFSNYSGGGENAFQLLTGYTDDKKPADVSTAQVTGEAAVPGEVVVPGEMVAPGEAEVSADTSIAFKGEIPKKTFQKKISGFSDVAFGKNISEVISRAFPTSEKLFTVDPMHGELTLNRGIFADDPDKNKNIDSAVSFITDVLADSRAAYQSGKIKDTAYKDLGKFFNVKDFDERGFVNTVMNDYMDVTRTLEEDLIKNNLLLNDLNDLTETGLLTIDDIADVSETLDSVFGSGWHTQYLENVGLTDSTFRRAFKATINDFVNEKLGETGAGRQPTGAIKDKRAGYYTGMYHIKPERTITKDDEKSIPGVIKGDNYLEWWKRDITNNVQSDFGWSRISSAMSELAPTDYVDLQQQKTNLGLTEDESLMDFELITPEKPPEAVTFNIENAVKFKNDRVEGDPIENVPVTAATILRNNDIRTSADIINLIESNKADVTKITQTIVSYIMADIEAGLLPEMNSNEIIELAYKVTEDVNDVAAQAMNATSTDETITDEDAIDLESEKIIKKIDKEIKQDKSISEQTEALLADEPWLNKDGTFNPDYDPSELEGKTYERDTDLGRYSLAKQVYEQKQFIEGTKEKIGGVIEWIKGKSKSSETEKKANIIKKRKP